MAWDIFECLSSFLTGIRGSDFYCFLNICVTINSLGNYKHVIYYDKKLGD